MFIKPINHNVLVKIINVDEKTNSGFILNSNPKHQLIIKAEVIAVSCELENKLAIGSMVYIKEYTGSDFEVDNFKYRLVEYKDVLALLLE